MVGILPQGMPHEDFLRFLEEAEEFEFPEPMIGPHKIKWLRKLSELKPEPHQAQRVINAMTRKRRGRRMKATFTQVWRFYTQALQHVRDEDFARLG